MGQIVGNALAARNYKAQAAVAKSQGRARQAAYDGRARGLEEEARADSHLAARSMGRQRENQANAGVSARSQRASSGVTAEGSGLQNELALADIFEKSIADMSLSNAISDSNKRTGAMGARQQGRLAMMQADAEATQYRRQGKSAQNAAWIQGATTLLSAALGGMGAGMSGEGTGAEAGAAAGSGGQAASGAGGGSVVGGMAGSSLPAWATGAMSAGQSAYDLTGNFLQWSPGTVPTSKGSTTNAGNTLNDLLIALLGREGQQGGQAPASSSSRSV
ncbi:hypothetical protein CXU22_03395 [Akkermansia muciniphila]|uniref:Uncharacterized protein n=1 Tax=Akkermansia muciniphila TaxID=239935 RepID=A0A2N8HEZ1_9BACT|nr:hypothetical protein [Akkermansia muciniphila]PNC18853.1 hypothetical protein CXU22_03395 [Akkermansia muciniphila]